jgi:hypothetical protein
LLLVFFFHNQSGKSKTLEKTTEKKLDEERNKKLQHVILVQRKLPSFIKYIRERLGSEFKEKLPFLEKRESYSISILALSALSAP